MTKEELFDSFSRYHVFSNDEIYKRLEKFFNSNVVIPKGENRLPFADAVHEWIEDTDKELGFFDGEHWRDLHSLPIRNVVIQAEYRIKPQEPTYEYLWLDLRTPDDFYCPTSKYMTENEAEAYFRPSHTWFKVLETKRIRE
jgi:hypothetical protein